MIGGKKDILRVVLNLNLYNQKDVINAKECIKNQSE
jgi:hypothetical protein